MPEAAPLTETPPGEAPPGTTPDADIIAQLGEQPGAAPTDATKPVEKPAEKPPEPETPKESALLRSVQQKERRLEQARAADRQERQQWEQSFEDRLKRGIADGIKAQLGGTDPRALIKQLNDAGLKDQALADALLNKDAKTPEEIARAADERATRIERERQQEVAQRTREANETEYRAQLKALDEKGALPHLLDEWEPDEVVAQTYALVQEMMAESRATGRPIPKLDAKTMNERLLRVLDKRAKARQDSREARRKAKPGMDTGKAASQDATKAGANGSGHQGEKTGASATTTLGKGLGERPTVGTADAALLSDAEVIERANERLARGEKFTAR